MGAPPPSSDPGAFVAAIVEPQPAGSAAHTTAQMGARDIEAPVPASGAPATAPATGFDRFGLCLDGGQEGVWTGTSPNGYPITAASRNGFTDSDASFGALGLRDSVDVNWTDWCSASCDVSAPFYCVERR
jgi:hypothetical protein